MEPLQLEFPSPEYVIEEHDQNLINITVKAPLSRPGAAIMSVEGDVFTFDASPYFIKVKLPGIVSKEVLNIDGSFNEETATYLVKLRKLETNIEDERSEENDCEVQCPLKHELVGKGVGDDLAIFNVPLYGFANLFSRMFGDCYSDFSDIISIPNPDCIEPSERKSYRLKEEKEKWSDDHYLADTMETEHLKPMIDYQPPKVTSKVLEKLLDEEMEDITSLKRETWTFEQLSSEQKQQIEYQLIDILFGYAYNRRTTEGDSNVESAWTINKLSATLSWFEVYEDWKSVFLTCYKRCLTYPLIRSWKIAEEVHKDVVEILKLGHKMVIRCLLDVRQFFSESESRYILNTLYINDMCLFAKDLPEERFEALAEIVSNVRVTKYEVNEDIPLLEIAAHLVVEEENLGKNSDINETIRRLESLSVRPPVEDTSSSSSSSTSTSSSSDDSSSEDDDSDSSEEE